MSRVLLVEDDPDIRHLVAYKLGRAGFEVTAVSDGAAGLAAARHTAPDLVLLDIRMPGMSGIDVCRELRARRETAKVPILMLTARARPQDHDLAMAAGADDYLTKPFSPRELVARVEAVIARVHT